MFSAFPTWSLVIIYLFLAAALCFLSKKLADYVDALDKKTKISGALIGAVLLAAVTSLPELFTSISATILLPQSANLVTGNILGSNLFNLAIIGIAMVLFFVLFAKSKFEFKSHFIVITGVLAIYGVIAYGLLAPTSAQPRFGNPDSYLGCINWIAILIFIIYGITIWKQPKEKSEDEGEGAKEDPYKKWTLKHVVIFFIICAVLLVTTSVLITYCTDALTDENHWNMDKTLAGAIFLAIATSLPELVSTFTLCKKGNFNAALGDIIGSDLFNFLIIGLAEFMSYKTSLLPGGGFNANAEGIVMLILTVVALVFITASLIVNYMAKKKNKAPTKLHYALYIVTGVVSLSGYIAYLMISFFAL